MNVYITRNDALFLYVQYASFNHLFPIIGFAKRNFTLEFISQLYKNISMYYRIVHINLYEFIN